MSYAGTFFIIILLLVAGYFALAFKNNADIELDVRNTAECYRNCEELMHQYWCHSATPINSMTIDKDNITNTCDCLLSKCMWKPK